MHLHTYRYVVLMRPSDAIDEINLEYHDNFLCYFSDMYYFSIVTDITKTFDKDYVKTQVSHNSHQYLSRALIYTNNGKACLLIMKFIPFTPQGPDVLGKKG